MNDRAMKQKYRSIESLESRTLLSSASDILIQPDLDLTPQATGTTVTGLTPAQVKKAYGFDQVTFKNTAGATIKGDGTGQTIAIVDAFNDPDITSDLHTFDAKFSLPNPTSFKIVSETGGSTSGIQTNGGWSTEIALDVEWAHAIAPKANILLVEAKSDSITDLMAGVNYARSAAGVSVVSLSWGGSEFFGETSYDKDFTTPAGHQGVTFVAAAGDEGSSFRGGAEWPAVSPDVLSVGGTDLTLKDTTGTYGSEVGWRDSSGGISRFENEPTYQDKVQDTGGKTSPDVSYDADPGTGFAVYSSVSDEGFSGWQEVGGTSAGAPQWGALVAIADQGRVASGKKTLDGATGTLPAIYDLPASDFHDITSGRTGRFSASAGYDLTTGLGTPHANTIISALIGGTTSSSAAKTSTSTGTTPSVSPKNARGTSPSQPEWPGEPYQPFEPPVGSSPSRFSPPIINVPTQTGTTTTTTLSLAQATILGVTTIHKFTAAGAPISSAVATVADVSAVAAARAAASTLVEPNQSSTTSSTHLGGGVVRRLLFAGHRLHGQRRGNGSPATFSPAPPKASPPEPPVWPDRSSAMPVRSTARSTSSGSAIPWPSSPTQPPPSPTKARSSAASSRTIATPKRGPSPSP